MRITQGGSDADCALPSLLTPSLIPCLPTAVQPMNPAPPFFLRVFSRPYFHRHEQGLSEAPSCCCRPSGFLRTKTSTLPAPITCSIASAPSNFLLHILSSSSTSPPCLLITDKLDAVSTGCDLNAAANPQACVQKFRLFPAVPSAVPVGGGRFWGTLHR